jgi:ribosomal protein S18 acetylase RimI-like enzyme
MDWRTSMSAQTILEADGLRVRAPLPVDGVRIAQLWLELWNIHESWGSYPGSREPNAYVEVANRIAREAQARAGDALLGQHLHLVAERDGVVVGQVEGWLDRLGYRASTPFTCEVRSLIVDPSARHQHIGRHLLTALARAARAAARHSTFLVAEVLEPNPAHGFYAKAGFRLLQSNRRFEAGSPRAAHVGSPFRARAAMPQDAWPLVLLDMRLAERRLSAGDLRFDGPQPLDATTAGAVSAHLAASYRMPSEFVVTGEGGVVVGSASLSVAALEPPFAAAQRGMVGRLIVEATRFAEAVSVLITHVREIAAKRGSHTLEVADLGAEQSDLSRAVGAMGARAWSRIVGRLER